MKMWLKNTFKKKRNEIKKFMIKLKLPRNKDFMNKCNQYKKSIC